MDEQKSMTTQQQGGVVAKPKNLDVQIGRAHV